jgi:hypothetical protein
MNPNPMRQWLACVRPGPTPGGTVILRMKADPDVPAFRSLGELKHYAARRYAGVRLADVVCVWVRYRDWLARQRLPPPRAARRGGQNNAMISMRVTCNSVRVI